jgi:phosphatidylglycerophosphate synthase
MACAGAAYWWAATNRTGLLLVIVCLAINWLGDSLDGTLARFRDHSRPRYGFYVDHIVDAFSALFLLGGLALSGYMAPAIALGLLVAYLMLSVEVYLASYTLGDFKISYFKMGPTELRILLSIGNLALLWRSTVHLFGRAHRLFDVAGTIGISGMLLVMVISAIQHTAQLYRLEPVPVGKPAAGDIMSAVTRNCFSDVARANCRCFWRNSFENIPFVCAPSFMCKLNVSPTTF